MTRSRTRGSGRACGPTTRLQADPSAWADYARLQADPSAWADYAGELAEWDAAAGDGLPGE